MLSLCSIGEYTIVMGLDQATEDRRIEWSEQSELLGEVNKMVVLDARLNTQKRIPLVGV